jgi:hypothetical protein
MSEWSVTCTDAFLGRYSVEASRLLRLATLPMALVLQAATHAQLGQVEQIQACLAEALALACGLAGALQHGPVESIPHRPARSAGGTGPADGRDRRKRDSVSPDNGPLGSVNAVRVLPHRVHPHGYFAHRVSLPR